MPPPASPAIIDRRGTVTYSELEAAVRRCSAGLHERGVGPGDAVVLVTANERESVVAYRAITGLGAVAVLTHISAGKSEIEFAVGATSPRLVVASPGASGIVEAVPVTEVDAEPGGEPTDSPDPDAPRLVVFTSGTTSTPKGVMHTGRSLRAGVECFLAMTGLGPADRLFLVSPLASITGVLQAMELAPTVGAAAVLEPAFADEATLDLVIEAGATFYGGPDLVLDRVLSAAARRGVGVPLRLAALGGTMLRRELVDRAERDFGIRVVRVYGSSEAPCSAGTRPDEPDDLRLHDEAGELLVRGPHLFGGYVDPADTGAAVGDGWFRTGDAAELAGGRLRIVGRLKEVASRDGRKISLAEVEHAFTAASGLTDCAAFALPDERTGERVALAVGADGDLVLDVPAVLAAMEWAGLARWKLPESVIRIDGSLPTTASGKVQRRHLEGRGHVLWQTERLG